MCFVCFVVVDCVSCLYDLVIGFFRVVMACCFGRFVFAFYFVCGVMVLDVWILV